MRNNPQEIIDRMLHNGEAMLAAGRADQAFETYMEIVRLCPDPTAQYNLECCLPREEARSRAFWRRPTGFTRCPWMEIRRPGIAAASAW